MQFKDVNSKCYVLSGTCNAIRAQTRPLSLMACDLWRAFVYRLSERAFRIREYQFRSVRESTRPRRKQLLFEAELDMIVLSAKPVALINLCE